MQGDIDEKEKLGLINLFKVKDKAEIENNFLNVDNLFKESKKSLGGEESKSVFGNKDESGKHSKAQIFVLDKYSGQVSVLPLNEADVPNCENPKPGQARQNGFNHVLDKMIDIANKTENGFEDRFVFQFVPSYKTLSCFSFTGFASFDKSYCTDFNSNTISGFIFGSLQKRLQEREKSKEIKVPKRGRISLRFTYIADENGNSAVPEHGDVDGLKVRNLPSDSKFNLVTATYCQLKTKDIQAYSRDQSKTEDKNKNNKNDEEMAIDQSKTEDKNKNNKNNEEMAIDQSKTEDKNKNNKNNEEMAIRQNLKRSAIKGLKAFGFSVAAGGTVAFLCFVVPKGVDLAIPGFESAVFNWTVNAMAEIGLDTTWKMATGIGGIGFGVAGLVGVGVFLYSHFNSSNEHNGGGAKNITNEKDEISVSDSK